MLTRSLLSLGDTAPIRRVIEKARAGQEITFVFIGGSITEGALAEPRQSACFAAECARRFAQAYMPDPAKMRCVNAGISGTPTRLGVLRCEKDALRYSPDLAVIESAVNDGSDPASLICYESLTRRFLNAGTAVMLLFTFMRAGYSAQDAQAPIGLHYGLPMVSVRDAVQPEIKAGRMTYDDYSSDYAHPTTQAHGFIADMLMNAIKAAETTIVPAKARPEKPCYGADWEDLRNIRPKETEPGDFPFGSASCYSYSTGWVHDSGEAPLRVTVRGARMLIAVKQEKDEACGSAILNVDGEDRLTLRCYDEKAWGNVETWAVELGAPGTHTLTLRMAPGDRNKRFTLLDMGIA